MSASDAAAAQGSAPTTDEPAAPSPSSAAQTPASGDAPAVDPRTASDRPPPPDAPTGDGSSFRGFLATWGPSLLAVAIALAVTIRTHVFFIWPFATPVSNDEGYISAIALRLFQGHWLPYVDGISQRGPILYWVSAVVLKIWAIFGHPWSWVSIRVLGLALGLTVLGLVYRLSQLLHGRFAASIAVLVLTYFLTFELNPWDGLGVNGEPFAVSFAIGAAILVIRGRMEHDARSGRHIFLAGVMVACAALSKQMFVIHGVPTALWVLLGPTVGPQIPRRERWRQFGAFVAGTLVPYALVFAIYGAAGHLRDFIYYYQRYGRDIFMDPLTPDVMRDKLREQFDKYYFGIAVLGALWFHGVARAVRSALECDVAEDRAGRAGPWSAEGHVLANVVLPGWGLWRLPGRRIAGSVALGLVPLLWALRAVWRWRNEIPYSAGAFGRDVGVYFGVGLAAALVTSVDLALRGDRVQWPWLDRVRRSYPDWFVVQQAIFGLAGACFTFRFFPHYFVELFPFAAVLIGGQAAAITGDAEDVIARRRPARVAQYVYVLGLGLLLGLANFNLHRLVRVRREIDRWYQDPATDPIVKYVREKTTPDQSIFVWGFRAETYFSSQRQPASRYVYTVYPAGVVPWFPATHEEEERRVVPGSRQQLLDDLESARPELVIDAGRSMSGRYMYNYPSLRAYLDQHYCFMRYVDGEPVYRRRHGERCPPADY